MRAQRNKARSSFEPIGDRCRATSGGRGVKLATGHCRIGDQALNRNSITTGNSIASMPPDDRNMECSRLKSTRKTYNTGTESSLAVDKPVLGLNICGLSELHWKGSGHLLTDHYVLYFSGNDITSNNGVGFLIPASQRKYVMGYEPVSDRIIDHDHSPPRVKRVRRISMSLPKCLHSVWWKA